MNHDPVDRSPEFRAQWQRIQKAPAMRSFIRSMQKRGFRDDLLLVTLGNLSDTFFYASTPEDFYRTSEVFRRHKTLAKRMRAMATEIRKVGTIRPLISMVPGVLQDAADSVLNELPDRPDKVRVAAAMDIASQITRDAYRHAYDSKSKPDLRHLPKHAAAIASLFLGERVTTEAVRQGIKRAKRSRSPNFAG